MRYLIEAVRQMTEGDYRGEHEAPDADSGCPLHDLTKNGIYPNDVYSMMRHYVNIDDAAEVESYQIALAFRNRPNRVIRVYRAIPKEIKGVGIKPGDWVAISRRYAIEHGKSNLRNNYRVSTKVVHARDLFCEGNIAEWGYSPQPFDMEAEIARRARRKARLSNDPS